MAPGHMQCQRHMEHSKGALEASGFSIPGCTLDTVVIERGSVLGLVRTAETMYVAMTFFDLS